MKQRGFTLVEMMVALVIFALLAATGTALLTFGVRAQASASVALDDTARLRRLSTLLANDLAQALPRQARGPQGERFRAFTGNDGNSNALIMGYVRGGWSNPDGAMRPGVQRVDVILADGRLVRQSYPMIDGATEGAATVLADRVTALVMRYRDQRGAWRARWDNASLDSLPAAVEMTITRAGFPPLRLAWLVAPSYRPDTALP